MWGCKHMNSHSDKIIKLYLVKDNKQNLTKDGSSYYDLCYDIDSVPTPTLIYFVLTYNGNWRICTHYDLQPKFKGVYFDKEIIRDRLLESFESLLTRNLIKLDHD